MYICITVYPLGLTYNFHLNINVNIIGNKPKKFLRLFHERRHYYNYNITLW